jgi:TPR repeat protein
MCPFCKVLTTSSNIAQLVKKRIKLNDPDAFLVMGSMCSDGTFGQKKDAKKAFEWM